jgi:hypothetical protein
MAFGGAVFAARRQPRLRWPVLSAFFTDQGSTDLMIGVVLFK